MCGSFLPRLLWWLTTTKVYSGLGADIVYGINNLARRVEQSFAQMPMPQVESPETVLTGALYLFTSC